MYLRSLLRELVRLLCWFVLRFEDVFERGGFNEVFDNVSRGSRICIIRVLILKSWS